MKYIGRIIALSAVISGILAFLSAGPSLAASKSLGSEYVIDMSAGTVQLPENNQSQAAFATLFAMTNTEGVRCNWDTNSFDLDKDGSWDLRFDETETQSGQLIYFYTALPGSSIHGNISLAVSAETKEALAADNNDYYETLTFRCPASLPISLSAAKISGLTDKEYTGQALAQTLTVKMSGQSLLAGRHYQVTYQNNKSVGKATVVIKGIGTYSGTLTRTFQITRKGADSAIAKINALKSAAKLTLADKSAVKAARTAYDKLTKAQKTLITAETLKKLTDAEKRISGLEKEAADKAAADAAAKKKAAQEAAAEKATEDAKKKATQEAAEAAKKKAAQEAAAEKSAQKTAGSVRKGKVYTIGKFKYKVTNADMDGSGTVTLTGTTAKKKLKKLTVPASVKISGSAFKVTAIGNKAFAGCTSLTRAVLGKNIKKIGSAAFSGDKKLKTLTIKSTSLKSVGKKAIKGIHKKAVIKVPKKQLKKYRKLFTARTGWKKTIKIK